MEEKTKKLYGVYFKVDANLPNLYYNAQIEAESPREAIKRMIDDAGCHSKMDSVYKKVKSTEVTEPFIMLTESKGSKEVVTTYQLAYKEG